MNAIANLKKAYQSQAITRDTFSLQEFYIANKNKQGVARMKLVGIESKYIPQFDKNSPMARPDTQGNGFRTRFILEGGDTLGTFSGSAHQFYVFYAQLMGREGDERFNHIDIDGKILVDIHMIDLDANKKTYGFELVEKGSVLNGFNEYLPNAATILQLEDGTNVDTQTGEIKE